MQNGHEGPQMAEKIVDVRDSAMIICGIVTRVFLQLEALLSRPFDRDGEE
jgi:hypothetical protein